MAEFNKFVKTAITNTNNGITVSQAEYETLNTYLWHVKQFALKGDTINTINIDDVIEHFRLDLLKDKNYIINLIFSNGNNLYVYSKKIKCIEYFKIMIEEYNFDNIITNIDIHPSIDYYDFIKTIIDFVENIPYENAPISFNDFYTKLQILDIIGEIKHNDKNFMHLFIKTPLHTYEGVTAQVVDNIFTILQNNNIQDSKVIIELWKHINIEDPEKVCKLSVFDKIISHNDIGKEIIIKYDIKEYHHRLNEKEYYGKLLDQFFETNSKNIWNIIESIILSKDGDKIKNYISGHYYHKIKESIFDFNFKILYIPLQLLLIIKFKKDEYVNYIGNEIIAIDKDNTLYDMLVNYLVKTRYCGTGHIFSSKSHSNKYMFSTDNFTQVISYIPFEHKNWSNIGRVTKVFYNGNNQIISFNISVSLTKNNVINNFTKIMVNKKIGELYNIIDMNNVIIINNNDNSVVSQINYMAKINTVFNLSNNDGSIFNNIHVNDYIYV